VVLDFDLGLGLELGSWLEPGLIGAGPPPWMDVGWLLPGPVGWGGVCVAVLEVVLVVEVELGLPVEVVLLVDVVELELELELELDELELLVEVGVELVVDEGVELVVDELVVGESVVDEPVVEELLVVGGAQLIVSEMITPVIGSDSDETGVPAGTLTGNVNCCPPNSVTLTVHASAEAFGIAASPSVSTADVTARISLRLPNTAACLLLPSRVRMELAPRHMAAWLGRY
jgi:hypothetical protein